MQWRERPPEPKLIRIDIDPREMDRLTPDAGIIGDAKIATRALLDALAGKGVNFEDRSDRLAKVKAEMTTRLDVVQPQVSYLNVIRDELPRDGILVEEVSQMGFTARVAFPVYAPRTYIHPGYQETLGFGFQTAVGVKVANPDKAVVSMNGDGGFMFGVQELATMVHHDIGLVTLVFNNGGFGNVQRDQDTVMEGRRIGSDLTNPDFAALARSFGMSGERTDTPEGLRRLLRTALDANAPALIEIEIEPRSEVSPWDFIIPTYVEELLS